MVLMVVITMANRSVQFSFPNLQFVYYYYVIVISTSYYVIVNSTTM